MTAKFQFVELILRAHFYTDETRMCAHLRPKSRRVAAVGLRNASLRLGVCETEQLGPLNVWGASLRSVQGAASLVPLCGYPLKAKGVKSHAFCLFYCLTNTARTRVSFLYAV